MTNTIALFQISTEESLRFQLKFIGLDLSGRVLKVDVKERDTDIVKTTLQIGTGLTLNGSDDLTAHYSRGQMATWAKGEYQADIVDHTNDDPLRIVAVRFVYDRPGKLIYGVRGNQATVQWANNQAVVTAIGGVGPAGPANVLSVPLDGVETVAPDQPAEVAITGLAPAQQVRFKIPRGLKGDGGNQGPGGTITIRNVTTGAPGSAVSVTNAGTPEVAILDIAIPRGDVGSEGEKGWSPQFAVVGDGARRVLRVTGWVGGEGAPPAAGLYVGPGGLVAAIADAIDIRGPAGTVVEPGSISTADLVDGILSADAAGRAKMADGYLSADAAGRAKLADGFLSEDAAGRGKMADKFVTNAKLADVATATFKGRNTAGAGAPEDLTVAQAAALLPAVVGDSGSGGTKGLVPAPAAGDAAAGKVLGAGGTWISLVGRTIGETIRGAFTSLPALCLWKNGQNVSRITYDLLFRATTIAGTVSVTNAQTSATLTLADAEAVAQVQVGMPIEATGIQAGTTIAARGTATATTLVVTLSLAANATAGANAARVFPNGNGNGSTTFGVGDDRDRASVGRGNMGGTAADRLTQALAGFNSSRLGATGGDQRMQQHNHATGIPTANHIQAGGSGVFVAQTDGATYSSATAVNGAGVSQNVQPSTVDNAVVFAGA